MPSRPKHPAPGLSLVVSGGVLASILGVTPPRIVQLAAEGMPKESQRGYDLCKCIPWIIRRERKLIPDALRKKRTSLIEAQREKIAMEVRLLRDALIPITEHTALVRDIKAAVERQQEAAAERITDMIVGKTNVAEVQGILLREMRAIRAAIADDLEGSLTTDTANDNGDPKTAAFMS